MFHAFSCRSNYFPLAPSLLPVAPFRFMPLGLLRLVWEGDRMGWVSPPRPSSSILSVLPALPVSSVFFHCHAELTLHWPKSFVPR